MYGKGNFATVRGRQDITAQALSQSLVSASLKVFRSLTFEKVRTQSVVNPGKQGSPQVASGGSTDECPVAIG